MIELYTSYIHLYFYECQCNAAFILFVIILLYDPNQEIKKISDDFTTTGTYLYFTA